MAYKFQDFITDRAEKYSEGLAHEKGNFGGWESSTYGKADRPMRNAFHTTVAPTGTISIIADCSGGIEPLYALSFKREVMPDGEGHFTIMEEHNPYWKEAVFKATISNGVKTSLLEYAINHGSIKDFETKESEVEKLKKDLSNKKKEAFHLNCLCTILNPHSCKVKWTLIGKPDSIKSL